MKNLLLTLCCILCFIGCEKVTDSKIGISMPNMTTQRWQQDGHYLEKDIRGLGYKTELKFADDKAATQLTQINEMIDNGCKCLIISAVNGSALRTALDKAKEKKVKVIAYDRLLMNSDAVTAYITFDNAKVGVMMGNHIVSKLNLQNASPHTQYNLEIFSGDMNDSNSKLVYTGAMSVLQPYIDRKILRVKSSRISLQETSIEKWSQDNARERMLEIIKKYYNYNEPIDAILAASDALAEGVAQALAQANITKPPILTGQDCSLVAVKLMLKGGQSCSVFKDTRVLSKETAVLMDKIMRGKADKSKAVKFNNGAINVPSYLCAPIFVDQYNCRNILIDSGYYTKQQLER